MGEDFSILGRQENLVLQRGVSNTLRIALNVDNVAQEGDESFQLVIMQAFGSVTDNAFFQDTLKVVIKDTSGEVISTNFE